MEPQWGPPNPNNFRFQKFVFYSPSDAWPKFGTFYEPPGMYVEQEGWLSPTERASVSSHFGLPGYAPGTIAGNVTWMERGFNACQTHRNIYLSIFNRFPVTQPVNSKVRHFSTFLAHPPLGTPLGQSR